MTPRPPPQRSRFSALGALILLMTLTGVLAGTFAIIVALRVNPSDPPALLFSKDEGGINPLVLAPASGDGLNRDEVELQVTGAVDGSGAGSGAAELVEPTLPAPTHWIGRQTTWVRTEGEEATSVVFAFDVTPACNAASAIEIPGTGTTRLPIGAVTRGEHDLHIAHFLGGRRCSEATVMRVRVDDAVDPIAELSIGQQDLFPDAPETVWVGQSATLLYRVDDYDSPIGACITTTADATCPAGSTRDDGEISIPVPLDRMADSQDVFVQRFDAAGNEADPIALTIRIDRDAESFASGLTASPSVESDRWQSEVERVRLNWAAPEPGNSGLRGLVYVESALEPGVALDSVDPCDTIESEPTLLSPNITEFVLPSEALREGGRSGRFSLAIATLDLAGNCGPVERYSLAFDSEPDATQVQFRAAGDPILQVLGADGVIPYSDGQRIDMRLAARSPSGRIGSPVRFLMHSREFRDCSSSARLDRDEAADDRGQARVEWDPASMGRRVYVRTLDSAGHCGTLRQISFESTR